MLRATRQQWQVCAFRIAQWIARIGVRELVRVRLKLPVIQRIGEVPCGVDTPLPLGTETDPSVSLTMARPCGHLRHSFPRLLIQQRGLSNLPLEF